MTFELRRSITPDHPSLPGHFPDALYVEMGPGNVLTGLMGRLVKGARTFTCGTASDVEKLQQMVS